MAQRKQPSREDIGKKLREGFGIIGKLAKGDDVITEAAKVKLKKKKKPVMEKPPTPRITAGLRRHRASIKDRELRPSVAGLQRAQ